jgi:hypothetical protein
VVCPQTEVCDDGYSDACGACNADCTATGGGSVCGDHLVCPATEACDDGFQDACGSCNANCTGPGTGYVCGDHVVCPESEACDDGHTDACGTCNADCTGAGTGSTCGDHVVCPETETCDDGYQDACGTCNATCSGAGTGSTCGDSVVCPETETCDPGNTWGCGACNSTCNGTGITCAACADNSVEQHFANGMVGCGGTVSFANRANVCGGGSVVCTAAKWIANRAGVAPTYDYWVNDGPMYYKGSDQYGTDCAASTTAMTGGGSCNSGTTPMRVCVGTGGADPLGNDCNWRNCGWQTYDPNQYFGGCNGNTTAGALCCPP